MEQEIKSVLDAEKRAQQIIIHGKENALKIKAEADKLININNRELKDKITEISSSINEKAYKDSEQKHIQEIDKLESQDLFSLIDDETLKELVLKIETEILETVYKMKPC